MTQNNLAAALYELGHAAADPRGPQAARRRRCRLSLRARGLYQGRSASGLGRDPEQSGQPRFTNSGRAAAEKRAAGCSRRRCRLSLRARGQDQVRSASGLGHDPEQSEHRASRTRDAQRRGRRPQAARRRRCRLSLRARGQDQGRCLRIGRDPEQSGQPRFTNGRRSGAEEGRRLLEDAVAAYRSALEVYTKADLPEDWAMTQNNLGSRALRTREAQQRRRGPQAARRGRCRLSLRPRDLY